MRSFLGLIGYYRQLIQNYGKIASLLTALTTKESQLQFQWNQYAQMAFDNLKQAIISAPVLIMPNFTNRFEVSVMRPDGVGAMLMQQGQPIAYFSKALSTKTTSTSAYDRELMALALAIEYWQPYLRSLLYESTNAAFAIFLSNRLLLWLSNVRFLNCWATDL